MGRRFDAFMQRHPVAALAYLFLCGLLASAVM